MCEFCKNVETGDDYKALAEKVIPIGKLAKLDIGVYLASREDKASLVLGMNIEKDCEDYMRINYCPMCGRKFG